MDPHAASYRGFSECKGMTNFSENEILSREKSSRDVFSAIHEAIGTIRSDLARFDRGTQAAPRRRADPKRIYAL